MILQALNELYERLPAVPPFGFANKPVSFTLILDHSGNLLEVEDERTLEGKRLRPKYLHTPDILQKRAVNILPILACDNASYVLGRDAKGNDERTGRCHQSFLELHAELAAAVGHPAAKATCAFLQSWNPDRSTDLNYHDDIIAGGNIAFRLRGSLEYLHDVPALGEWWRQRLLEDVGEPRGQCLVTGQQGPPARLHPSIKGVRGAQSAGASIVSFNLNAFESYAKTQNLNAPVGREQAFRYATALNWLLDAGHTRRLQVGDATTVYWTATPSPIEDLFGDMVQPPEDPEMVQRLETLFRTARDGAHSPDDLGEPTTPFFVLGLSPNSSRLAVRFWTVSTVAEIASRMAQHFEDLRIVPQWPSDQQRPFPPLWLLLRQTATQGKAENVPPLLAGAMIRAILTGVPYPLSLLQALTRRVRAEPGNERVNYLRAAAIKASLNRIYRTRKEKEVTVSLDTGRMDPAYRLGRMFAVLEIVQRDALGDPNASITDRYYAAASATPAVVFPRLVRLSQHHLGKLDPGPRIGREKLLQEIADAINDFPAHLGLEEQGLFALGYYHQKKDCYTSKQPEKKGD